LIRFSRAAAYNRIGIDTNPNEIIPRHTEVAIATLHARKSFAQTVRASC
jgi:hypothetical protein